MKGRAIPVLPTRDTQRTLAFYQRLGFANAGAEEWSNDYLVLRAGEVEIHFFRWDDLEPLGSGALCHIRVATTRMRCIACGRRSACRRKARRASPRSTTRRGACGSSRSSIPTAIA